MSNWPLSPGCNLIEHTDFDGSNSYPSYLVTGGTTHVKTGWTQLLSATTFPWAGFAVQARGSRGDWGEADPFIFDIGIGAAASEVVLIPDFYTPGSKTFYPYAVFHVPIPANTRIAFRGQGFSASQSGSMYITGFAGQFPILPYGRVEALGVDLSDTTAEEVDPGATANTVGSWVSIGTSTFPYQHIVITTGRSTFYTSGANAPSRVEIGIGAGGSEITVLDDMHVGRKVKNDSQGQHAHWTVPMSFPSGTEFFARSQCSSNDTNFRKIDVAIHGVG